MLNKDIANELGNRIGGRVFLYCLLNALFLLPIVIYLSFDASNSFRIMIGFVLLVLAFSSPMALLNGWMTRFWMRRIPDNVSITMTPEVLRQRLFLSNYLGLPLLYVLMTVCIRLLHPPSLLWWFLIAIGAWLFSGFISVSAIDSELRLLSIYGSSRKSKIANPDTSQLLDSQHEISASTEQSRKKELFL